MSLKQRKRNFNQGWIHLQLRPVSNVVLLPCRSQKFDSTNVTAVARRLKLSCPLEFFIVFRPKNTEKIMRQSYAYVANESTPARIKLNYNTHISSDIHTLYWYAWDISVLSHFFTAVWFSIKWNYFFAFLLSALRAQYQHPSMTAKKAVEKIFAALIKINWSWYTQYPLSWPFLSHFRVGHGTRKNFANIPSSP